MVEAVLFWGGFAAVIVIAFCCLCACISNIDENHNEELNKAHYGYYRAMKAKKQNGN